MNATVRTHVASWCAALCKWGQGAEAAHFLRLGRQRSQCQASHIVQCRAPSHWPLASAVAAASAVAGAYVRASRCQAEAGGVDASMGPAGAAGGAILAVGGHGGVQRLSPARGPTGGGHTDSAGACTKCGGSVKTASAGGGGCGEGGGGGGGAGAGVRERHACGHASADPEARVPAGVVVKKLQAGARGDTEWGFYEAQFRKQTGSGSSTEVCAACRAWHTAACPFVSLTTYRATQTVPHEFLPRYYGYLRRSDGSFVPVSLPSGAAAPRSSSGEIAAAGGLLFPGDAASVVLEDLTAGMAAPCVADIKVGTKTWRDGTSRSKVLRVLSK